MKSPSSAAPSGGKVLPEPPQVASSAAWGALEGAPYGVPLRVRDAAGTEVTAIRDPYVQWFDENRSSAPLPITPIEWRAL